MLATVPRAASTLPSHRSDGCEAGLESEQEALEWSYPVAERACGVHDAMDDDEEEQARYLTVTRPSLRPHVTLRDTALHSLRSSTAWHSGAPSICRVPTQRAETDATGRLHFCHDPLSDAVFRVFNTQMQTSRLNCAQLSLDTSPRRTV
jgi:hypothetical protein